MANFTDGNTGAPATEFEAKIDWGDGEEGDGTVVATGAGSFAVRGSHKYEEAGTYTVTVNITDSSEDKGGVRLTITSTRATIADAVLRFATALNVEAIEGKPLDDVPLLTFVDTNANPDEKDFTATIDWGDPNDPGTTTGKVEAIGAVRAGALFRVSGSHTYSEEKEGGYTITITVIDVDGARLRTSTARSRRRPPRSPTPP